MLFPEKVQNKVSSSSSYQCMTNLLLHPCLAGKQQWEETQIWWCRCPWPGAFTMENSWHTSCFFCVIKQIAVLTRLPNSWHTSWGWYFAKQKKLWWSSYLIAYSASCAWICRHSASDSVAPSCRLSASDSTASSCTWSCRHATSPRVAEVAGTQRPPRMPEVAATRRPPKMFEDAATHRPTDRPEDAAGQLSMKRAQNGCSLPPKKRPHIILEDGEEDVSYICPPFDSHGHQKYECRMPEQQQTKMQDPLLHKTMVTPPVPIFLGQNQTPSIARSYTHVSSKKICFLCVIDL